jgi:hypothetical protein
MLQSKKFSVLLLLTLIFLVESFFIFSDTFSGDAAGSGVLISQVQVAGKDGSGKVLPNDEFIELYNGGDTEADLRGWALKRVTEGGSEYGLLADIDAVVPAHRFLLIAPRGGDCSEGKCYLGSVPADRAYSTKSFLAENNGLILYDPEGKPADSLGWGNAPEIFSARFIGAAEAGKSLLRQMGEDKSFLLATPFPRSAASGETGTVPAPQEPAGSGPVSAPETAGAAGNGNAAGKERKIRVSEFLLDPVGEDGEGEFIELYNAGSETADLQGWTLEDQAGKTSRYVFAPPIFLGAGEYLALGGSDTKISLNNSGDGVVLRDERGALVQRTPVSPAASEGAAFMAETEDKWVWTTVPTPGRPNLLQLPAGKEVKPIGTKKEEGDKPVDTVLKDAAKVAPENPAKDGLSSGGDYADNVVISEALPDPSGRDNQAGSYEWVEIHNQNDRAVNLRGWFLDDIKDKGSKAYRFTEDRLVPAGGYLVVSSEESKLSLNNGEEEINLLWPDQRVADHLAYAAAPENKSYALAADGTWFWSGAPSPGKGNGEKEAPAPEGGKVAALSSYEDSADFSEEETEGGEARSGALDRSAYSSVLFAEIGALPLGKRVCLSGVVSVPAGTLGKNVFYLSQKGGTQGVQVFSYQAFMPEFLLGDEVRAYGFLSQAGGERRLVLEGDNPVEKMGADNLLNVAYLALDQAEKEGAGSLVKVEGAVAEITDRWVFYLSDGSGRLKVYAKPDTGITLAGLRVGEKVTVTGVLSRSSLGLRLLPRFSTDIHFLEKANDGIMEDKVADKVAGSSNAGGVELLVLGGVVLLLLDWLRLRLRRKKAGFQHINH